MSNIAILISFVRDHYAEIKEAANTGNKTAQRIIELWDSVTAKTPASMKSLADACQAYSKATGRGKLW